MKTSFHAAELLVVEYPTTFNADAVLLLHILSMNEINVVQEDQRPIVLYLEKSIRIARQLLDAAQTHKCSALSELRLHEPLLYDAFEHSFQEFSFRKQVPNTQQCLTKKDFHKTPDNVSSALLH